MSPRKLNIIRWIIAVLLVWAALSKIAKPQEFLAHLLAYRLPMPDGLLRFTAVVLPWVELLAGFGLLTRHFYRGSLALSFLLFVAFTLATGQGWLRGLDISCGCLDAKLFGFSGEAVKWMENIGVAFVRAALLAWGCALLIRFQNQSSTLPAGTAPQ